jgi:biopolymer transport protein ExbB
MKQKTALQADGMTCGLMDSIIKGIAHLNTRILALIALLLATGSSVPLWSQAEPTTQEVVNEKIRQSQQDVSLLGLYLQGGPLMHVIALCSIGTIAIAAYCAIQIRPEKMMPKSVVSQLNDNMSKQDVDSAFQVCQSNPCAISTAAQSALVKSNFERDLYNKDAMAESAAETIYHEETRWMLWVNYLNVFATLAPMLGLLGTVAGMIEAFNQLAAGRSEPDDLAGGIGQAMVTTAGGLLVGIPAMFCYFFFRNQIQSVISSMQKAVGTMLDLYTGEITIQNQR